MKKFKRVYLTIDEEVMEYLGLNPDTVTAAQLRKRLKEAVKFLKDCDVELKPMEN